MNLVEEFQRQNIWDLILVIRDSCPVRHNYLNRII